MLQKAGGLFQLLAEVDFGTTYGLKSVYYKTRTSNIADAGQFRLARADVINWRNQANDGNLSLGVSASNALQFNGTDIQTSLSVSDTSTINLTLAGSTLSADIVAASIDNSMISGSAAIAFSKLAALTSGNILVGSAGNVATSVAMSGDITISNAGVTAIGSNKVTNAMLAQVATARLKGRVTASTGNVEDLTGTQATSLLDVVVGDSGSGGTKGLVPAPAAGDAAAGKFLKADGIWTVPAGAGDVVGPGSSTDNGFARFDGTTGTVLKDSPATIVNADVNAAAAIAYSKLNLSGSIVNADINAAAAIAYSKLNLATSIVNGDISGSAAIAYAKLAALTASRALQSSAGGVVEVSSVTATELGYLSGVSSALQTQIDAKQARSTLTTKGDLYVATASATVARQGVGGTNGLILTEDSGQTNGIRWASPGAIVTSKATADSPYTVTNETNLLFNAGAGIATVNLPAGSTGRKITVTKISSDFNVITIDGNASEQIREYGVSANTTRLDTIGESVEMTWDGTLWEVTNRRIPSFETAYTPALQATSVNPTLGANSAATGYWTRIGTKVRLTCQIRFGNSGVANGTGSYLVSLPTGLTTATTVPAQSNTSPTFGSAILWDNSTNTFQFGAYVYVPVAGGDAFVRLIAQNASAVTSTAPWTWADNDTVSIDCIVPITGWKG